MFHLYHSWWPNSLQWFIISVRTPPNCWRLYSLLDTLHGWRSSTGKGRHRWSHGRRGSSICYKVWHFARRCNSDYIWILHGRSTSSSLSLPWNTDFKHDDDASDTLKCCVFFQILLSALRVHFQEAVNIITCITGRSLHIWLSASNKIHEASAHTLHTVNI